MLHIQVGFIIKYATKAKQKFQSGHTAAQWTSSGLLAILSHYLTAFIIFALNLLKLKPRHLLLLFRVIQRSLSEKQKCLLNFRHFRHLALLIFALYGLVQALGLGLGRSLVYGEIVAQVVLRFCAALQIFKCNI